MRLIKYFLTLTLLVGLITCKPQPTPQQKIQSALEVLLQLSPEDNARFHQITVPITWSIGDLKGTTLAATTIYYDRAEIVFDWQEIQLKRERLEPIIAHELDHIYDAFIVYGAPEFTLIVEKEKSLPWKDRTVEKSALNKESQTRRFLLKTYPDKFKGMLPDRAV